MPPKVKVVAVFPLLRRGGEGERGKITKIFENFGGLLGSSLPHIGGKRTISQLKVFGSVRSMT
jgi:hypothetical protein